MLRIRYRLIPQVILLFLFACFLAPPADAQDSISPRTPARQVGPTPILPSPTPAATTPPGITPVGAPGLTPTVTLTTPITATFSAPLTPGFTATLTSTLEITGTAEVEETAEMATTETAEAQEVISATLTAQAATPVITPTPFRYIRVQPREVARTLLEKILSSALILVIGWVVATLARALVTRLLDRIHPDVQLFLGRLTYIIIWIGAILWILRVFEVEIATLTAIVGSLGLALSLSSQDLFKNFIAGLYLLMERPFYVGDIIKVGDYTGRVEFIDLRTTKLVTSDGRQVILPNTLLMSQVVVRERNMAAPQETAEDVENEEPPDGEAGG